MRGAAHPREATMGPDKVIRVSSIEELDAALDREAQALLREAQKRTGAAPFALRRAVDASLPRLTRVDAGLPNSQMSKTKPAESPPRQPEEGRRDASSVRLITVDARLPNSQISGTNP